MVDSAFKVAACACFIAAFVYLFNMLVIGPLKSPLRRVPGPPPVGWFAGHLAMVMDARWSAQSHDRFMRAYGQNFRIQGFGYHDDRLLTLDPVAITYILSKAADNFPKPWQARRFLARFLGEGLIVAHGAAHKRQRKVVNPAFSPQNLRALTPIFFGAAEELRDTWLSLLGAEPKARVDINAWMSQVTFEIIGLAGFDYKLGAIQMGAERGQNKVLLAFQGMMKTLESLDGFRQILAVFLPAVDRVLPSKANKQVTDSQKVIYGVGTELINEKKQQVLDKTDDSKTRSLLSLLIKANMAESEDQRLTHDELLSMISTFLFAGSDTSSIALTWTLHQLALNPSLQSRLRDEVLSLELPSAADASIFWPLVDALSYLDKVCKESLRLVPPVHSTIRVAAEDDVIPTSEPVILTDGTKQEGIRIAKGQFVHVPMEGFSLNKEVWGEDAWNFNPDRWDNLSAAARKQPGLIAGLLTFGLGPRSCPGSRFAFMEMKIVLAVLLSAFEFSEPADIIRMNFVITRPYIRGQVSKGSVLPLTVTPLPSVR